MNKVIPQLTFDFIEWMEEQETSDKTIVEFGSGNSTLYFSNKFKNVITYEDEPEWIEMIKSRNIENIHINFLDYNFYKKEPDSFKNADFILIDNNPRDNNSRLYVAQALIEKINYKNTLVLDNGNWNADCYFYLRTKYNFFNDFIGINPRGDRSVTTVFYGRK